MIKSTRTRALAILALVVTAALSALAVRAAGPDRDPPTVSLRQPADGATVSGTISLEALVLDATGGSGVAGVQFVLDDGVLLGEELTEPTRPGVYGRALDTTSLRDGPHTLSVLTRDALGNRASSTFRAIAVVNGAEAGLVGRWPLDEGSGTRAADDTGRSSSLELQAGPVWIPGDVGRYALDFPRRGVALGSGSGALANLHASGLTVSAWIRPRSSGGSGAGRIVDKDNDRGGWLFKMASASSLQFIADHGTAPLLRSSTARLARDRWQHVAATWDGTQSAAGAHIYIDGVQADAAGSSGAGSFRDDTDSPLAIGNRPRDGTRGFDGGIDDVRVYRRVLSPEEIRQLARPPREPPPAGAPYPPSALLTDLTWDWASTRRLGVGSDIWSTTWGPDGAVWTAWGDGGGMRGNDNDHRVSLGFGFFTGTPPNLGGVTVWGDAGAPDTAARARVQATFCGKADSILAAAGVLYAWVNTYGNPSRTRPSCPPNPALPATRIAYSRDRGASWTLVDRAFPWSEGSFVLGSFVNFGRDHTGVPESLRGYVYFHAHIAGDDDDVYLIRAPQDGLLDAANYQVFTGLSGGQPTWSSSWTAAGAASVFHDANLAGAFHAIYHAPSGRFIATVHHGRDGHGSAGTAQRLGVFESPVLWGDWRTVYYTDRWGPPGAPFGDVEPEGLFLPTAWISSDGRTLWAVYSSERGPGAPGDALNLTRATLGFGAPE